MADNTGQAVEAHVGQEGKTYGYQQPPESEQVNGAGLSDTDKRRLMRETFERLMDIMFGKDNGSQPGGAGTPGTTGTQPSTGGTVHTSGTSSTGSTSGTVHSGGTSSTSGAGASDGQGAPALGRPSPGAGPTVSHDDEEAFGVPVASVRESFRRDRAMEHVRRAESAKTPTLPSTHTDRPLANKHLSDSNKAPLRAAQEFAPSFGLRGRSRSESKDVVAVPAGRDGGRPETVPAQPRASGVVLDAYWGSFGTAVERARERIRMAGRLESETMVLEKIIGPDDRELVTNTTVYPWRCICSLLITAQTGSMFLGTGWLVSPRLLLTAGHCVYMSDEGGWATQIDVIPGRNGASEPFGRVSSFDFRSVSGWTVDGDRDYDYGAILLPEDKRLGDQLGWFGFAIRADDYFNGLTLFLSGYPGDGGKAGPQRQDGTQWFHARTVSQVNEKQISYEIDTYGGQSGAPVWENTADGSRYGLGIHTWGDTVNNGATRITHDVFDNIVLWTSQVP